MKKSTQEIAWRTCGRGSGDGNDALLGEGYALFGEAANDAVFEVRRVG